jgi:hypothetical protein
MGSRRTKLIVPDNHRKEIGLPSILPSEPETRVCGTPKRIAFYFTRRTRRRNQCRIGFQPVSCLCWSDASRFRPYSIVLVLIVGPSSRFLSAARQEWVERREQPNDEKIIEARQWKNGRAGLTDRHGPQRALESLVFTLKEGFEFREITPFRRTSS